MLTQEESLDLWHRSVKAEGGEEAKPLLTRLFAEDITFRAPLYLTPRQGRDVVIFILETVSGIFENFTYHRELVTPESWALEFSANIGKYEIKGMDLMAVNADGQVTDMEVYIRPLNGLTALGEAMHARMAELGMLDFIKEAAV